MPTEALILLGGIGLFLYGMQGLTAELRIMTSDNAREAIRRHAGRPLPGVAVGAALTALIQSSSATMVMVLGFVGAGVLTFTQSLGLILGANIGTTFTGWMVMLFGVKINLGLVAFPVLFGAGLVRIMARGALARAGGVLAGLSLIFIGIDLMKDGMALFDGLLTPQTLPTDTLTGRLQILGLGVLITVITQSSSAGVAATIVLLAEGHVSFTQAAALAIGTTVGTTFTGILASIGGTLGMRRTALANLVFNLTKGVIALALLDGIERLLAQGGPIADPTVALVIFHTGFTIIGAALFLPVVGPFGRAIERLLPERKQAIERELDPRFLADPSAALDVALTVARRHAAALAAELGAALDPGHGTPADPARGSRNALIACQQMVETEGRALDGFVARINLPEKDQRRLDRLGELLGLIDHLRRLAHRAGQTDRITVASFEPALRREARYLGALLGRLAMLEAALAPAGDIASTQAHGVALAGLAARLNRSSTRLAQREQRLRRRVLKSRAAPPRLFAVTDSMRWLRRSTAHVERVVAHLAASERLAFLPDAPAETAAPEATPPGTDTAVAAPTSHAANPEAPPDRTAEHTERP